MLRRRRRAAQRSERRGRNTAPRRGKIRGDRSLIPLVVQAYAARIAREGNDPRPGSALFISCSVDIAPKWGEYERMTATALNAYIGPVMARYLGKPRPAAQGVGLHAAAADHAVRGRLDLGGQGDGIAAADARLRPRVGRHGFAVLKSADGLLQHHHDRHGRNFVRCRHHFRRPAGVFVRLQRGAVRYSCPGSTSRRSARRRLARARRQGLEKL